MSDRGPGDGQLATVSEPEHRELSYGTSIIRQGSGTGGNTYEVCVINLVSVRESSSIEARTMCDPSLVPYVFKKILGYQPHAEQRGTRRGTLNWWVSAAADEGGALLASRPARLQLASVRAGG